MALQCEHLENLKQASCLRSVEIDDVLDESAPPPVEPPPVEPEPRRNNPWTRPPKRPVSKSVSPQQI